MFHKSAREIEVTRDFKKSYTFNLEADIDTISVANGELIFSQVTYNAKTGFETKYYKFSSEYTSRVFDILLGSFL